MGVRQGLTYQQQGSRDLWRPALEQRGNNAMVLSNWRQRGIPGIYPNPDHEEVL
ncbi:hypothetical protein [Neptunomonas concharum]|uniref:hypothetical protein n=1 Tax=Neptunomonas concharum TaxID=1031538 RepID=UPI0014769792|nr:hypothetical protein [Neptunomonas concharum]